MKKVLATALTLLSLSSFAGARVPDMDKSKGYIEPFQLFDNVFYVGDKWVSAYAVRTTEGLVLIDTLEFPYSRWIPINLKKLGLEKHKITHIIVTHGHSDHVGGANYLQSIYSSKVVITEKDYELAKAQSKRSKGIKGFKPPTVDGFPKDGAHLVVGDTTFKFYITPGHTEGCLSIDFLVKDQGKSFRAFVVGGHGLNFTGVDLAEKFVQSIRRINSLAMKAPKVSVNLANHPNRNSLFELRLKHSNDRSVNPFVDESNFFSFIKSLETSGQKKLQQELKKGRQRTQLK